MFMFPPTDRYVFLFGPRSFCLEHATTAVARHFRQHTLSRTRAADRIFGPMGGPL
jgi:hypothetical protein